MPLLSRAASMGARALGWGSGYTKAPMIRTGSTGNIANVGSGYSLSGFDGGTFAYLNAGKTSGKWYWEYKFTSSDGGFHMTGITDAPSTTVTNGGYSTANAGIYAFGKQYWIKAWAGASAPSASGGIPVTGDTYGFALDMDSATKTLGVYFNNTLIGTLSWTQAGLTLYPMFAFQGGSTPSGDVLLGPGACQYSPPSGYRHI